MAKFLTRLKVENADNADDGKWVVVSPLIYQSDVLGQTITVPTGFQTDFASVPRVPFIFEFFGDTSVEAAVIHDWLYTPPHEGVSRIEADDVLYEASKITDVPFWRRYGIFLGVRFGGKLFWAK